MEIYVQEAWSVQFMPRLPRHVKLQILNGVSLFSWALDLVLLWCRCAIPNTAWPVLFHTEAKDFELHHLGGNGRVMEEPQSGCVSTPAQHGEKKGQSVFDELSSN